MKLLLLILLCNINHLFPYKKNIHIHSFKQELLPQVKQRAQSRV